MFEPSALTRMISQLESPFVSRSDSYTIRKGMAARFTSDFGRGFVGGEGRILPGRPIPTRSSILGRGRVGEAQKENES